MIYISEIFYAGGIIMVPLALASFLIWYLLAYRSMKLFQIPFSDFSQIYQLGLELSNGKPIESINAFLNSKGLERKILNDLNNVPPFKLRKTLQRSYEQGVEILLSDNKFIRTLINIAPLLGLLGTVMGMVETFRVIGVVGTSEPRLLARGISMAMITTQIGLLIAVPALFIEGRVRRLEQKVLYNFEELKLILMQCFKRDLRGG